MISRIKRQIETWQICADFEGKRIEDTSKKLLKQQKFLLKEKRLAQNTPELILERLRKQTSLQINNSINKPTNKIKTQWEKVDEFFRQIKFQEKTNTFFK
jgi:ribosome biogenesis protein Tsr3